MSIGSLAAEVAKLHTESLSGISDLGERDRLILKVAKTAIDALPGTGSLAEGKIWVGDTNDEPQPVTPSGIVAVTAAGVTSLVLASGKVFIGDSNGKAAAQTPSGVVAVSVAGVTSFSSNFMQVTTTGTNGEVAISGMTTNGAAIVVPQESASAVHVVPAAGKITVYAAGTTNVANAVKVGILVLSK